MTTQELIVLWSCLIVLLCSFFYLLAGFTIWFYYMCSKIWILKQCIFALDSLVGKEREEIDLSMVQAILASMEKKTNDNRTR